MIYFVFGYALVCDKIRLIASGLNMNIVNTTKYTLIAQNCCQLDTGVVCKEDGTMMINWSNMGLNGTLNSSLIPESVTSLVLYQNLISGSISSLSNLSYVDVSMNRFSGNLPNMSTAETILASNNSLTGALYTFPQKTLNVSFNNITGGIDGTLMPSTIEALDVKANLLNGTIGNLPTSLKCFDFSIGNKLKGSLVVKEP